MPIRHNNKLKESKVCLQVTDIYPADNKHPKYNVYIKKGSSYTQHVQSEHFQRILKHFQQVGKKNIGYSFLYYLSDDYQHVHGNKPDLQLCTNLENHLQEIILQTFELKFQHRRHKNKLGLKVVVYSSNPSERVCTSNQ